MKKIEELVEENYPDAVSIRRRIHSNPELGYKETATARLITEELLKLGFEVEQGVGGTGVIGVLDTGREGPNILYRADMDALPVVEETEVPFKSKNYGVMHACGHDLHVAIMLLTAKTLVRVKDELCGKVVFLFQPAEESLGGAIKVKNSGALEKYEIDEIYAGHVWQNKTGVYSLIKGVALASSTHMTIKIKGKSGHAAKPEESINPIPISAAIINAIFSYSSAYMSPFEESLINICSVKGGEKFNIIPDEVIILGTVRAFSEESMNRIQSSIRRICENLSSTYNAESEVFFEITYPPVVNDERLIEKVYQSLKTITKEENIKFEDKKMIGEDFSYYLENLTGAYILIGADEEEYNCILHSDRFNPDERAIYHGALMFTKLFIDAAKR